MGPIPINLFAGRPEKIRVAVGAGAVEGLIAEEER
jgi:hypothetical protein